MTTVPRLSADDRAALDAIARPNANRPWTVEDIHRAKHCWRVGASVGWIALELDRFDNDVSAKLRALGVLHQGKARRRLLFATDHHKFKSRHRKHSGDSDQSSLDHAKSSGDQTKEGASHGK